jgi:acetyl-CoA carboxylase biotin carboxyl carrier protein
LGQDLRGLISGERAVRSSQEETVGSENPLPGLLMSTEGKVRSRRLPSHRRAVGSASDRQSNLRDPKTRRPCKDPPSRKAAIVRASGRPSSTGGRVAEVEAHITGTVWKVECEVGDEVEEGDTVVILESMKMEMPVEAEDPGVVKEILCEEGQAVNEGDTLVILE